MKLLDAASFQALEATSVAALGVGSAVAWVPASVKLLDVASVQALEATSYGYKRLEWGRRWRGTGSQSVVASLE